MQFEEALTYDDVLLLPQQSQSLPHETDLTTRLTRNISIKIPVVSSAMDTVTESTMAIALAQLGGIGIIHKNLTVSEQVMEVEIVKRAANGIVNAPKALSPTATIREALELKNSLSVSSFPIIDEERKVLGIVTNRDFRFVKELDKPVSSIMTKQVISTDGKVSLEKLKEIFNKNKIEKLVVVDKQNQLTGLICIKDILADINYPQATKDDKGRLRVGAACGVSDAEKSRVEALIAAEADVLVVDTAHGHHIHVSQMVKWIKDNFPHHEVIAGNVATSDGAKSLIDVGVDAVKVGIGPGSICTTRVVTGVGVPQVTAILNCAEVCHQQNIPLIADGGIRFSGDAAKALALGAQTVMLGSVLAGVDEAPGETFFHNGVNYKVYRGMGSLGAMAKGSKDRYFQAEVGDQNKLVPEGIEGAVPIKGELKNTVFQLLGGIRSAMGYCGTEDLQSWSRKAQFIKVTQAGFQESHVHDVMMIKEAPNYKSLK